MITIDANDMNRTAGYPDLVDSIEAAFRGDFEVPLRHHHPIARPGQPDATLLLMPAWTRMTDAVDPASRYIGLKQVTIFPGNEAAGEPTILGVYILMSGTTGRPLAMIDAPELTVRRTASASALAARYLAREDASTLLCVGAGALAPCLVRAHASVRPIRDVMVWNRNGDKARALAETLRGEGMEAKAVDDLDAAVGQADIVTCSTMSDRPLVKGALLRPGTHVDLVGAYRPDLRESDDEVMRRARIFVDTREGALSEGGDVVQPLKSGAIAEGDIVGDLFDLTAGRVRGRTAADEITAFKSVGTAIEDLAVAILLYERCR